MDTIENERSFFEEVGMSTTEEVQDATSRWGTVCGVVSATTLALTLLVLAFVWPSAEAEPDGMSVAVAGPSEAVDGFTQAAGNELGEIVDLVSVGDRPAAVEGIKQRDFIGALVLEQEPEVLTASANGQVPDAIMAEISSRLQSIVSEQAYAGVAEGMPESEVPGSLPMVQNTDVAPYSDGDPNGVGMTTAGIPLTVGALLVSVLISFSVVGRWQRVSAVLGFGIGAGFVLALVLGSWLQVYPGVFGTVWLALTLSLTATSALFVGMHSILGKRGLGLSAVLTLFAAMPWAAFAVPYQFLPAALGHIGQWLIPGATTTLTRTVSYFPDASVTMPWWVLTAWVIFGLGLATLAPRGQHHSRATEDQ